MTYERLRADHVPPRFDDVETERLHRKRQSALAYRLFASQRWGQLGDGHISTRDPERPDCFWLLRYGVPFGQATIDDLVLVLPDGRVEIDGSIQSTGEINETAYYIHMPIHEARPDVVCVAHTHTQFGTPWSANVKPFEAISQEALSFVFSQSIFDGEQLNVTDYATGEAIAAALADTHLCMMRNHGFLTTGSSVAEAIGFFVMAERVAEVHVKATDAKPISDDVAKSFRDWAESAAVGAAAFEWMLRSVIADPSVVD